MPKGSVNGHSPAFPSASQALNAPALRFAAAPHDQPDASSDPAALEATFDELSLGLTKPNVQLSPTEAALRDQVCKLEKKATPYTSKHGVSAVDLNCRVHVRPSKAFVGSEAVECRHLATLFATSAGKKRDVMQSLSTKEGVAEQFAGKLVEIEVTYKKTLRESPAGCKHLVNSGQLGAYLQAVATQLQAPGSKDGPSQANCLFLTADHVMALHVESKSKNGVGYFSAKLYDPNDTAIYRRVVKANPEDFGNLTLKDMMISPRLISLYAGGENKLLSMVAVSLDHRLQPPMDRSRNAPSPDNMHLALECGLLEDIQLMLKFALEESRAPDKRIEPLSADSLGSGPRADPGLFVAVQHGQSDAGNACAEENLASKDSALKTKINLLAAKDREGTPGLFSAFQHGQSDAVRVFAREVLASTHLTPQAKTNLLAALDIHGMSGLCVAFVEGHTETVTAFTQEVLAAKELTPQDKSDLLAAWHSDEAPGLYVAFEEGHLETIMAFAQEVLASDLSEQTKLDLLAARNFLDTPGLCLAFEEGHLEVVKAFTQEVLKSGLSEKAKVALLAAEVSDGVTGLLIAREMGHSDTVKAFADEILDSDLSQEAKDKLLPGMNEIRSCSSHLANSPVGNAAPADNPLYP